MESQGGQFRRIGHRGHQQQRKAPLLSPRVKSATVWLYFFIPFLELTILVIRLILQDFSANEMSRLSAQGE